MPLGSDQAKQIEERTHSGWWRRCWKSAGFGKDAELLLCVLTEFVTNLLANGKGAAFFVQPHSGTLGPFETKAVDVTAYTDMWGEYRDSLICKVRIFILIIFLDARLMMWPCRWEDSRTRSSPCRQGLKVALSTSR